MAEYASNGKGNLGVTLGAIGTGLSILGGVGNIGGILPLNGWNTPQYATKDDVNNAILLAQKDSEIALLKSEQNTEIKIADVYERIITRVNADKAEQAAINQQQAVYNCAANSNLNLLRSQVDQLLGMTVLHIPATNVCPEPMARYNSWTAPTTVTAPATTT